MKIRGYVVAQVPNLPLVLALVAVVAGRIFTEGSTAWGISRAVFFTGLAIWAYLELVEGVNGFRRVLGAGGLAWVIYSLSNDLA